MREKCLYMITFEAGSAKTVRVHQDQLAWILKSPHCCCVPDQDQAGTRVSSGVGKHVEGTTNVNIGAT